MVKTHMSASLGMPTPGLDHSLPMMADGNSGVDPSLLGDFDLFSASAYQAELDYLSFPFMDSFLAESSGDLTFALASAMDSHPPHSSGSSSPSGSSMHSPVTPQQQSSHHSSSHDHHRAWSINSTSTEFSDLDSPFPLFTENIFSPSFIPKQPQNQRHSFPSEEHSCDGEGNGDIHIRLLDLQTRISNLVKNLHEGRGSSNDCKDILGAGKSLINLLDGVSIPSRMFATPSSSPFSSEPTSPMSSGSSTHFSSLSSSSSPSLPSRAAVPNNMIILSLSSCYATLLHAYEVLVDSMHHQHQHHQHQSHNNRKYNQNTHTNTPLLSPASSISSFSSKEQQGYFFSSNLDNSNNAHHLKAMAQMVQKLKHALQRCMVRMGRGQGRGRGQGSSTKKKEMNNMDGCSASDDMLMGLSRPELLEMGWGEEDELFMQQQQPFMSW